MMTELFDVLMVEDDHEQAELIVDTSRVCKAKVNWKVLISGEAALEELRAGGKLPGLVLLDLHLPKLGGVDVLKAIKADPKVSAVPVIIMSHSREQDDIAAAYRLGANCYIAKPASFEGLCSLVRFIEAFLALPVAEAGIVHPVESQYRLNEHTLN
jgi:two-component system, response regulator